jgi:hypothetical protein
MPLLVRNTPHGVMFLHQMGKLLLNLETGKTLGEEASLIGQLDRVVCYASDVIHLGVHDLVHCSFLNAIMLEL